MDAGYSLSASASSSASGRSSQSFDGAGLSYGAGAWNVNLGGSGQADFVANAAAANPSALGQDLGGVPAWVWVLAAVGLVWALK